MRLSNTPEGRRLDVSRSVSSSPEAAWELLTDPRQWPDWGPSVTGVRYPHDRIRPDTEGKVRLPGGLWVPFRIDACKPYRWTWNVAHVPATGHRVEPVPDGCRVVFEVPLFAAGYAPVCSRALDRIEAILEEE